MSNCVCIFWSLFTDSSYAIQRHIWFSDRTLEKFVPGCLKEENQKIARIQVWFADLGNVANDRLKIIRELNEIDTDMRWVRD